MVEQPARKIGKHKRTGWAIAVAIALSFVFYVIYRMLFSLVVSVYASYDPSFGVGLGAFVLLGPGANVLSMLSGAATVKSFFKKANMIGVYYGMATFMVVIGVIQILREAARPDASLLVVIVLLITIAAAIIATRFVLIDAE